MHRIWLVLAVLGVRTALAQAPAYTADSIVNAADYSSGPFAPNSVLTVFGSNLSWYTATLQTNSASGSVPTELGGVTVSVDNVTAPLLYVSATQVNFLVPSDEIAGNITVRVVRQGVTGPAVTLALVDSAPALFDPGTGFTIATHADGSLLTDASPARPGEIIVVYATGLGPTEPNPEPGEVPQWAATLVWINSLVVSLNGTALPSNLIEYAGLTPGCVGLYQLNVQLPQNVGSDPVIQVSVQGRASSGNLKIAVQ